MEVWRLATCGHGLLRSSNNNNDNNNENVIVALNEYMAHRGPRVFYVVGVIHFVDKGRK